MNPAQANRNPSGRDAFRRTLRHAVLSLALMVSTAQAQNFAIDWFTIDGGGGASSGGAYTLSGTIGQPDAGVMSGGNFTLQGGFWSVVAAIQNPEAPYLYVLQTNGAVTVYWERPASGFVLEHTPALTGSPPPWTPVALPYQTNATHISITEPAPAGNQFYRLRKP